MKKQTDKEIEKKRLFKREKQTDKETQRMSARYTKIVCERGRRSGSYITVFHFHI